MPITVRDGEDEEYFEEDEEFEEETVLGPDERDMNLLDGTWEERYYAGNVRHIDWGSVFVALSLLALLGMVVPGLVVVLR